MKIIFSLFWICLGFGSLRAEPAAPSLSQKQKTLHLLNRLTFGSTREDVARLRKSGIRKYIEEQLDPEALDDSRCEKELQSYGTLRLSSFELYKAYPPPEFVFKKGKGKSLGAGEDQVKALNQKIQVIHQELSEAKLVRMVESRRQLLEVMDDFWFNHFNVSFQKNRAKWLLTSYERDVIRPNALGKFPDLLKAVAHSPAMLEYLDNAQSVVDARYVPEGDMGMYPRNVVREMAPEGAKGKYKKGLNENYARELMELHTLGVEGGYSQKDLVEVARVLTGWGFTGPQEYLNGKAEAHQVFQFKFRASQHDKGTKTVMGQTYGPDDGEKEGDDLLDFLSRQPATARFISQKLCRKFVGDDPPSELVDRVARRFLATGGDIKETLRTIFKSPEFLAPDAYRAKVKTPLEFVVSALRATGAHLEDPSKVARTIGNMGEPLYLCEPPTGYPDTAKAWVSSSALLNRLNFGMSLLRQNPNDPDSPYSVDLLKLSPRLSSDDGKIILQDLFRAFLGGDVSKGAREALYKRLGDPAVSHAVLDDRHKRYEAVQLGALVLGSPDFQRR